jgi:RND family efflux transporter MFP subunit
MGLKHIFFPLFFGVVLLCLPVIAAENSSKAPLVVVAGVIEKPAQPYSTIPGTIIPLLESTIASRVEGFVEKTSVMVGEMVKKGDELVVIDSLDTQRQKQIQFGIIAEAKAYLSRAQNNLARDHKLRDTPALSRQRLADRTAEVAIRKAILSQARSQLAKIQDQLTRHQILAPFSGIITEKLIQSGEWIKEGQGVVTLLDPTQLEVKALIPAHIADSLSVGDKAEVYRSQQGDRGRVVLRAVLPRQHTQSRNRPSFWTLEKTASNIANIAGQELSLNIALGSEATMILALKDAIIRNGKKTLVFVVEEETIRMVPVTLGPSVTTYFQILKGLKAGDQVVVRGNERVRPGQKVRSIQLTGSSSDPSFEKRP